VRIVLGGYIVGYPLGGMTWHHLNYLLGLVELGHEVTFLEDGAYHSPWNPLTDSNGDPTYGIDYLEKTTAAVGLNIPWHYRYGKFSAGLSIDEMQQTLRSADLFIAVSGVTPTAWYPVPRRSLVIDTDPVFTQIRLARDADFLEYYKSFSHQATFGRLIGTTDCALPTCGLNWIPTNQPVSLAYWPVTPIAKGSHLSTIGKWEHSADRHLEFAGKSYLSSKRSEYERLLDLPRRAGHTIELGMASMPRADIERYESHGWRHVDATQSSIDVDTFRRYVQSSLGEFSVAKQIYAGVPSGWFSDRSSAFLASGRPVVVQATGFEKWLPTGEGLHAFTALDEAVEAVRKVHDYAERESAAARAIAERYLDARVVLRELLSRVM
jgi:hypothetical protein